MIGTLSPEPTPAPTLAQLRILIDRSAKGLSPDERARLRVGVEALARQVGAEPPPTPRGSVAVSRTHSEP